VNIVGILGAVVFLVAAATLVYWMIAEARDAAELKVDMTKARQQYAGRGYHPKAAVYPHPWEGKQVRLLEGQPELGLDVGAVGLIRSTFVDDDTEIFVYFDGRKRPIVLLEHEAGRLYEVLP
jgi:hypothetical protein